MAPLLIMEE